MRKQFLAAALLMTTLASYAANPLWTFTPLTATTITVPSTSTATIQYLVTNQSANPHTLVMNSIRGISQVTSVVGICNNPFILNSHESCVLSLSVDGSALQGNIVGGPVVCQQGSALQCYQPSAENSLNISSIPAPPFTSLSISVVNLVLETSGNARIITINNTGTTSAENLSVSYPTWPSGTIASSDCGSSLAALGTCTITVTPGSNATSDCNSGQGSEPTPGEIAVSANNASTVTTDVIVLTYGCIAQQGYVFAIDDTTPNTVSISGSTVGLVDILSSSSWDDGSFSITGASSLSDGAANTVAIVNSLGSGVYAAFSCTQYQIDSEGNIPCITGQCYTDWYLPAICQMGASGEGAGCSAGTPNVVSNLSGLISGCSGAACLSGEYWSSTEVSIVPQFDAWFEFFSSGGSSQSASTKSTDFAVRCARGLVY